MTNSPADRVTPGRALTLANVADGAEGLVLADLARAVAAKPGAPAISLIVVCRDGPRLAQLARARSGSLRRRSPFSNFRRGTANPMTGFHRTAVLLLSA